MPINSKVKGLIVRLIGKLFKYIPWSLQETLNKKYIESRGENNIFKSLAKQYGIKSIVVDGAYGLIEGHPDDQAVIQVYGRTGKWAERTNDLLLNFFDGVSTGLYLDIGANIGLTTIPVAQLKNVSCVCFEPDPINFKYLERNINRNSSNKNVTIKNFAIGSESNTSLPFEVSPNNFGDHRLKIGSKVSELQEDSWPVISVPVMRLDDVVPNFDGFFAVKVDTQGAEPLVISGGSILNQADLVILEFSPYWMERMGADPEVIYKFLENFSTGAIGFGECLPLIEYSNIGALKEELQKFYAKYKNIHYNGYCDIVVRK